MTSFRKSKPPVDQYAAAATLYFLLTGKLVFDFPDEYQMALQMILVDDPIPIRSRRRDIPQELADIIHQGLASEPGDRFADVKTMRKALMPIGR